MNHNGDFEMAKELVDAAAEAGVDAVKFQTYNADQVISPNAPKAEYQKKTTDPFESQLAMARELELTDEETRALAEYCNAKGIQFLSSPFDLESVDLLVELDVPAIKVGSGELTNWPLLRKVATSGKPLIVSTGMSFLAEVDETVRLLEREGVEELLLLHCVSSYPAVPEDANLKAMETMVKAFGRPVGFSDHTLGVEVALSAVALGACFIEKHFTLDKHLPGPDHQASLEPRQLASLVRSIRTVESAAGNGKKVPAQSEEDIRGLARRSLVVTEKVNAGQQLVRDILTALRPASGIEPTKIDDVVGKQAARDLDPGTILKWSDLK